MAKIIVNAISAKSGGAATYLYNLAHYLAVHGGENQFFFYAPSQWETLFNSLGGNVSLIKVDVGQQPLKRFIWDQFHLRRILREQKADALISSSDFGMWAAPCKQILMVRNGIFFSDYYKKNVLSKKNFWSQVEFFIKRLLVFVSVKYADIVVTASNDMMNNLNKMMSIPDAKTVVNPFGISLKQFDSRSKVLNNRKDSIGDKTFKILHVSEYGDYKNITTLLKAIKVLKESGVDNFFLTSTANPSQFPQVEYRSRREDELLASAPLVLPFIKFINPVAYEKIPELYAENDLLIFPSLVESFGHPLIEAMASGIPVLASDIPICHEICGDAALYFQPLDPTDLSQKIFALWRDEERRRRFAEVGRRRVEKNFRWEDHAERFIKILEERLLQASV